MLERLQVIVISNCSKHRSVIRLSKSKQLTPAEVLALSGITLARMVTVSFSW